MSAHVHAHILKCIQHSIQGQLVIASCWEEIKVILISWKDFMDKAKLELRFRRQGGLKSLCEAWTAKGWTLKLRSTNNLVKTPGSTMACHEVGHMCIHQILPLGMAYFGPVKIQPIYFGLSFGKQFISVTQSCLTLCAPMNHSTPGLPVHHQLPGSTQTRVHCVGDAIQPSHPLSSPSPPGLNLS